MIKVHVIGISGGQPLPQSALDALEGSRVILASKRLYGIFCRMDMPAELVKKCKIIQRVDMTIASIKKSRSSVAVLASGDPLFFGIGKRIRQEVTGREIIVYPALSSLQLAFAASGIPSWHGAEIVSFHGPKKRTWVPEDIPLLCQRHSKLAVLTGGGNTPDKLAAHIPDNAEIWVAEKLGYTDQRVRKLAPARVRRTKFKEPNIMLILPGATDTSTPVLGLNEDEFRQTGHLITKDEVRAVALHKLRLPVKGVLWDVGAGTGAVGIEARRLSPGLDVYCIEKDRSRAANIKQNAIALKAGNINVISSAAPDALKALPKPDRVFIGGSGKDIARVIALSARRLSPGGLIVITAITLETLEAARAALTRAGLSHETVNVSVSKSSPLGGASFMKAQNPIFIIKAPQKVNK